MFSPDQWLASTGTSFFNGVATQSLRFDGSSRLEKNFSSEGSRQKWTISVWVKRTAIEHNLVILGYSPSSTFYGALYFHNNRIRIYDIQSSSFKFDLQTNALYRDASAWYHIVVSADTTQSTASNRIKMYVNGVQVTSFAVETYPSLNLSSLVTDDCSHSIGRYADVTTGSFKGYMSEFNLVDGLSFFSDTSGTANTSFNINSFGETKNGVWIAKEYSGSYGTNGFRLQFDQTGTGTASSSTIGADTSGNNNHFTSSGIVASDCNMPDSPENGFATICPLSSEVSGTFSEGNLKYYSSNDAGNANQGISSGNFYAEVYVSGGSNSYVGVIDISKGLNPNRGGAFSGHGAIAYKANGDQYSLPVGGSSSTASYGATYSSGDIIGIAVDVDADTITFYKNGVSQGNTTNGVSHISSDGVYSILVYGTFINFIVNFGQDSTFAGNITSGSANAPDANGIGDFYYTPQGLALCTSNLPEPTISPNSSNGTADEYLNTVLYIGNNSTNNITGVGFQPDFVWLKNRTGTAYYHQIYDSTRGATKALFTPVSNAEDTISGLTAFDSDGFTVGNSVTVNNNGVSTVAWNWKANGGTTTTNDDGNVTATVQANTDAGFSIVTYTGNSSALTIGHGLGKKPAMVIVKNRTDSSTDWIIGHKDLSSGGGGFDDNKFLKFDTPSTFTNSLVFGTEPTTTTIALTTGNAGNLSTSGKNYVAYCFAEVEGYSRFGSYIANGSNNGTFVHTGFEISFLMIKRAAGGTGAYSSWAMYDNVRKTINSDVGTDSNPLFANKSSQEGIRGNGSLAITGTRTAIDFLSNGFKLRDVANEIGVSGNTYIYMAFAKNPFKYSTAQ